MSSIIERLTEGVVNRDMRAEGHALLSKWEKTGLLEGLDQDVNRKNMARLLENQAKELLRESSTMSGGDVEGFAAVAFPIVRRVFAGLIANDLVSVQPMSLPSGLIFFMDFTTSTNGAGLPRLGYDSSEESLYGGGRIASQITGGVVLTNANAESGPYALNNGYASPTASIQVDTTLVASGTVTNGGVPVFDNDGAFNGTAGYDVARLLRFDADLVSGSAFAVATVPIASFTAAGALTNMDDFVAITITSSLGSDSIQVRRLMRDNDVTDDGSTLLVTAISTTGSVSSAMVTELATALDAVEHFDVPQKDDFIAGGALGSVIGDDPWGLEAEEAIPEIDIKVDSIAITAVTKKLKAKWTPELGQDLNAYHNLDAEVELTSILSEQIALEIDREILEDLVKGATAGTQYWSRSPGLFLDRETGTEVGASTKAPDFTGTVSEWYETLVETINDVSAQIHRKTLRGGANFIVCSPEVANILEFTAGFRASVTADDERGSVGAVRVGALTKKFDVYVDPYFLRNVILVGRRGNSFLESGYVYAPYVPLQTTPTIFGPEDFVPRKGVMTRYAKKMVRPDMYGLVICRGLLGESGS
ncbi:MAG: hypothetical protein CMC82_03750 [Flavobacteriaceae bacterium]|nr:hypothetical protein [Flavobacteriaceae bacterium]